MTTESASLFTTIDYLVVVVYLLLVVVAGSWVGRGRATIKRCVNSRGGEYPSGLT